MNTSSTKDTSDQGTVLLTACDELSHTASMVAFLQSTFVHASPEDLLHEKAATGLYNMFEAIEDRIRNVETTLNELRK